MQYNHPILRSRLQTILLATVALFLAMILIGFPEQSFHSSLKGLKIWWEVVFPSLLPFFVASELLMGFGVVHFMGVLLEPLMRPLFRVPGAGGFVMAVGLASGYPIGAKLTARLREQKLITRSEGERLASFTNASNPLFMFGAIAVGFFHDASLGLILAIAHYSASILLGLLMRFHDPNGETTPIPSEGKSFFLLRALKAMHRARMKDGRSLGKLMGDAMMSSLNTSFMIGGFIMLFAVILDALIHLGWISFWEYPLGLLLSLFQIPSELSHALIAGFFEMTLGAQTASLAPEHIPLSYKIAIAGAITSWSGLSVHAQVASILSKTDIRYLPYLFARLLHGLFAAVITLLIWHPVHKYFLSQEAILPANLSLFSATTTYSAVNIPMTIGLICTAFLLFLIGIATILHLFPLRRG